MASTSRGYPLVGLTDAPNGPAQLNALAQAVDADVKSLIQSVGVVLGPLDPTRPTRVQAGTAVIAYATGGAGIFFASAFAYSVQSIVVSQGDPGPNFLAVVNSSVALNGFKVKVWNPNGTEAGPGNGYRVNWIAVGQ